MRISARSIARLFSTLALASLAVGCGGSYDTTKIKDYRMTVVNGTPEMVAEFKRLIADFNDMAGIHALTYVDSSDQANSPIIITKGLKQRTGDKVGLGQWLSQSEQDNPITTMPGDKPERTVRFSMRLEFDQDYFETRKSNDKTDLFDKQKLFFHEVGHGLELLHDPSPRNLMYEVIDGPKDFTPFFEYVRDYMSDT